MLLRAIRTWLTPAPRSLGDKRRANGSTRGRRLRNYYCPSLDVLEDRRVMSVSPLADDAAQSIELPAEVLGRHVFYNHSHFDGNNAAANAVDDLAIATDKLALLPGQTASFANVTSYSSGINGVMIDVQRLAAAPTADDFVFQVGNSNNPGAWTTAPAPASITVRAGAGVDGSSRVTIIWPDNAIHDQWLQVVVRPTAVTGLQSADVFYFGNRMGLSGIGPWRPAISIGLDLMGVRHHPATSANPAPITHLFDYNRDRLANSTDELIVVNNLPTNHTPLQRIAPGTDFSWSEVVGRHLFFNASEQDGFDPESNAGDDAAIADGKQALLPGSNATEQNYTTFEQGINGVMIDVAGLSNDPTFADFEFRVGNNNHPADWSLAPAPLSIMVRQGAGVNGSDRVTITWEDYAITNAWLQVTLKSTANTRLAKSDVFYFGNAVEWILPASSATLGNGLTLYPLSLTAQVVAPNGSSTGIAFTDFVKSEVVGRSVFYNQSQFDRNNPGPTADEDGAIATDKQALLPGGIASINNVTSYSRGINGVMVDIAGLPDSLSAEDFSFRVGNSVNPDQWTEAPAPSRVTVRLGAGVGGSARVTITWPAGWIKNQWLQVTVKATPRTGLKTPDVFYFGNLIGNGTDMSGQIGVTSTDMTGPRNNPATMANPAEITAPYDFNRDTLVNSTDEALAQPIGRSLKVFTAPAVVIPQQPQRLSSELFAPGDAGYNIAFAPDLAKAPDGTILAIAEGRWGWDDHTSQALIMRRSFDNGVTWTPVSTIYSVPITSPVIVHGPSTVVDEQTGTIFLLFTLDNSSVLVVSSTDNGATWSEARDITASVKVTAQANPNPAAYPSDPWAWFATGPGHGIQMKNGPYAGRLVIGADHRLTPDRAGPSWSHIIYSDDHGVTWRLGGGLNQAQTINDNSNEISVAETSDGRLYMSIRINDGVNNGKYRGYSFSSDGGQTWTDLKVNTTLTSNQVQGTLLRINDNVVLFASPDNPDSVRRQMTIWVSYNNMVTWFKTRVIAYDYAGYSDMVLVGPDTVLLAYNSGHADGGSADYISLARFNLNWLTGGDPDQFNWYFNEQTPQTPANIEGTTIEDASAWDNRGAAKANTLAEAPMYIAGRNSGDSAIALTEGSDYIQLTPDRSNAVQFRVNESFTAEFVIRTTDADGVLIGSSAVHNFANWSVMLVDGFVKFTLWDRQLRTEVTSTTMVNDGQWHHVAVVRAKAFNTVYIYVDGVLAAEPTMDVTRDLAGIGPVTLGAFNDGSEQLAVDIDAVRISRTVVPNSQFLSSQFVAPPPMVPPVYPATAPDSISGLQLWMPSYDPTRYFSDMHYSDPLPVGPAVGSAVHSAYDASPYRRRVSMVTDSREVLYGYDEQVGAHWRHDAVNSSAGAEWVVNDSSGTSANNFDFVQSTGQFTLSTFIKVDVLPNGYAALFDTAQGTSTDSGFTLVLTSDGSLRLVVIGPDSTIRYAQNSPSNVVQARVWYHIAVVGNGAGQGVTFYVTPVTSAAVTRFMPAGTILGADGTFPTGANHDLHIGSLAGTNQAAFDGYMVDQAIYDRPLSLQEITRLFQYTKQS